MAAPAEPESPMKFVRLGQTGLQVSRIVLGCMSFGDPSTERWKWTLKEEESEPIIKRALDLGINFFDTANMYSAGVSETILGNVLRKLKVPRNEVVIATKVFFPDSTKPNQGGLSRKHIFAAIDQSLKNLGMDYVDLYQIHRFDPNTPLEETMEALHDLVKSGKVRYIGASSMYAWQFAKAQHIAELKGWTKFVSMQNHYNAVYREEEREMNPFCLDSGVGIIPWSPLARGLLTGTRNADNSGESVRSKTDMWANIYNNPSDPDVLEAVKKIAEARKTTPSIVALAWLFSKPGVTGPIIGPTKMKHLEEAVEAVKFELSQDEIKAIEAPYKPHAIVGHF